MQSTTMEGVAFNTVDNHESLHDYLEGRKCHPVHINEEYHSSRYRILHRLGHGGFSTVWLALDQKPAGDSPRFVAIKFLRADSPAANQEIKILQSLNSSQHKETGQEYVLSLLDVFEIEGPNGNHKCLVTEFVGPSLSRAMDARETKFEHLPVETAKKFVLQTAQGLAFLHSRDIVHGDIHGGNITCALPAYVQDWTVEDLYACLGKPRQLPIEQFIPKHQRPASLPPSLPRYCVPPIATSRLWALSQDQADPSIRLIDFSESFILPLPAGYPLPGTPAQFAAPELIMALADEIGIPIDIWAFATTAFQLLTGWRIFINLFNTRMEILNEMVMMMGKEGMPQRYWDTFYETFMGGRYFNQEGECVRERMKALRPLRSLEAKLKGAGKRRMRDPGWDEQLRVSVRHLVEKALRYEPKERMGVKELGEMLQKDWEAA